MAGPFRSSGLLETNWAAPFPKFYMFIASDDICETIGKPQQATGNCVTGKADLQSFRTGSASLKSGFA